jgi:hypothetical protein
MGELFEAIRMPNDAWNYEQYGETRCPGQHDRPKGRFMTPDKLIDLIGRLRRIHSVGDYALAMRAPVPVNPDGPEAADQLTVLMERVRVLEEENGALVHDLKRVMERENNFLNELERIKGRSSLIGYPACLEEPSRAIAANKRGSHPHSAEVDKVWTTYKGQAKACILAFLEESAQRQKAEARAALTGEKG